MDSFAETTTGINDHSSLADAHHSFSDLAARFTWVASFDSAIRAASPSTQAEAQALLDTTYTFAARLSDVDQVVFVGHVGRLIDDARDAAEVQR